MSILNDTLAGALWEPLLDVMGDEITYTHGLSTVTITGIWDTSEQARESNQLAGALTVKASDLPEGYGKNDTVVIAGVTYVVRSDPSAGLDGIGGVTLKLRKQ